MKLKEKYKKEVIPEMKEKFGYKSIMAAPKIEKVSVNAGIGRLIAGKTSEGMGWIGQLSPGSKPFERI